MQASKSVARFQQLYAKKSPLDSLQLNYYLLSGMKPIPDQAAPVQVYGVMVEMFSGNTPKSQAAFEDISTKKNEVSDFLALLSRNVVTPLALQDVVEDYIVMR